MSFVDITFDGNNNSNYPGMIRVYEGSDRFVVRNCTICNVKGPSDNIDNLYPLWISVYEVRDWVVDSCHFYNISNPGDKQPINKGFVGAIRYATVGENSGYRKGISPSAGRISRCVFRDIWTETNILEDTDADAIRVSADEVSSLGINATAEEKGIFEKIQFNIMLSIDSCSFYDVQKSAVKAGDIGGMDISNCLVSNNRNDFPMAFGFRTNYTRGFRVKGCEVRGNVSCGIYIGGGASSYVSNFIFIPYDPIKGTNGRYKFTGKAAILLGGNSAEADRMTQRCVIRGVYASSAINAIEVVNYKNIVINDVTLMKGSNSVKIVQKTSRIDINNVAEPFEKIEEDE